LSVITNRSMNPTHQENAMIDICPLCGRYSLTPEYPPKPCPICEEELLNKSAASSPRLLSYPPRQRPTLERRPDA
jgi:hypothetical protein